MKKFKRQNSAACSDVAYRYLCTTGRSPHCIGGYLRPHWGVHTWGTSVFHRSSVQLSTSLLAPCSSISHSFKNAFQSAAVFKALAATGLLSGTCWVGGMKENLLCSFFISRCPIATLNPCFHNTVNLQLGLLLEDFVRLGSGNVVTSNQTEEREGGAQQVYPF